MKILHLRASNFYGGPERQLHYHCRRATGAALSLIVGSFLENGRTPEFLDVIARDNIPTHTFEVSSAYDLKAIRLLRAFLRENRIDILCTHDYRTHIYGRLARRGTKARWVAFSRGWTKDDLKVRLYNYLDKFNIRFADHIVAVSESQSSKLARLLIASRKITVVHNAVDPKAFTDIPEVNLKERFSLPDDALIAVSGGRFSAEKGQLQLVDAAGPAIRENNRLVFILFGDGPDLAAVRNRIAENNLSDKVLCPGFETGLLGCLKGADMVVNPSLSEGLPNILLEAMAVGTPCVATEVGGVSEIIDHDTTGLLCPPSSPEKLAEAIVRLAGDSNLRSRLSTNALETVRNRFSFESQFKKLETVYNHALNPQL